MAVEAPVSSPRGARPATARDEATPEGGCSLATVTRLLSLLLGQPLDAGAVRDRAVALGLLRLTDGPGDLAFTSPSASRLLLAGYHLPANLEVGSLPDLQAGLQAGCVVFAILATAEPDAGPVPLRVHDVQIGDPDGSGVLLDRLAVSTGAAERWPLAHFAEAWAQAGNLLVAAAPAWSDLPRGGSVFFAGSRSADGTYHWNGAECDTDGEGHVLGF